MKHINKLYKIGFLLFFLYFGLDIKAQTITDHEIITISNDTLKYELIKEKITLINFWFIGCFPCMKEMPELNKLKLEFNDKINFFAYTKDNSPEQVSYFIKKFPFNFKHILPNQSIIQSLKINLYPTNILYNKKGEIVFRSEGYDEKSIETLRNEINKLLNNSH